MNFCSTNLINLTILLNLIWRAFFTAKNRRMHWMNQRDLLSSWQLSRIESLNWQLWSFLNDLSLKFCSQICCALLNGELKQGEWLANYQSFPYWENVGDLIAVYLYFSLWIWVSFKFWKCKWTSRDLLITWPYVLRGSADPLSKVKQTQWYLHSHYILSN